MNNFALRIILFVLIMVVGSVVKKLAERKERANRPQPPKPPAPPVPRQNQFRSEIEAFLEEVGRRRAAPEGQRAEMAGATLAATRPKTVARPPSEASRAAPPAARPLQPGNRPQPAAAAAVQNSASPRSPKRPGAEIAGRRSPVSQDLGKQIRTHVAQLEPERLAQQAQADVGNAVEQAVRSHLGNTLTRGTATGDKDQAAAMPASPLIALLRNPTGMRTAVLVNEILGPPKGLRRKS